MRVHAQVAAGADLEPGFLDRSDGIDTHLQELDTGYPASIPQWMNDLAELPRNLADRGRRWCADLDLPARLVGHSRARRGTKRWRLLGPVPRPAEAVSELA